MPPDKSLPAFLDQPESRRLEFKENFPKGEQLARTVVAGRTVGLLIGSYRLDIDYECRAGLIDAIVVTKELQGRGLGRALIGGFAEWAGNEGCTTLQVINGAREFFEAMGFAERQVTFHQVPMDGLAVAGRPANGV